MSRITEPRNLKAMVGYILFYLVMSLAIFTAVRFNGYHGLITLIALITGTWLFGYLALHPKVLVLVALLGITFSRLVERIGGLSVLTYLDEGLILACVAVLIGGRLFHGKMPRGLPGGRFFVLFMFIGLISSVAAGVEASLAIQGGFLTAKGLLLAWAVAQISWSSADLRRGCRFLAGVLVLLITSAAINLAMPQTWANLFQNLSYVDYRIAGLPSIIGLTTHPLDLGGLMLFSAIAVAAYRNQVNKTKFNLWLLSGAVVAGILTFRRTTMAAMAAILGLEKIRQKGLVAVLAMILVVPIAAAFVWDTIMQLVNSAYVDYVENADEAARTILTFDSLGVAADHFPLGAGFARFGSHLAATNYSPEYVQRGYQSIWGMGPVPNGRFLTDTQWPAIIGETGYIGAILFVVGMFLVAKHLWHLRLCIDPLSRWVGITGLGILGGAAIMSATIPVYTSSTFIAPLFCIIGVAASIPRPASTQTKTEFRPCHSASSALAAPSDGVGSEAGTREARGRLGRSIPRS